VVASPLAASGFCSKHGEHLLVAESPEDFAASTIRLLQEPSLREKLGTSARKMIQEHYDWTVIGQQLLDLVEDGHA
jgi:glycosyltransferase involved in cell wall biosynthesis